jgi:hypothetical protein
MTDFNPDPNRFDPNKGYDKYGNSNFDPVGDTGRGPYILLGILVAIGLIGGLLYFNGTPRQRTDTAKAPDQTMTTPMPAPAQKSPATPGSAALPTNPTAPATQDTPKQ